MKQDLNNTIKEIEDYCKLNDITDSNTFVVQCLIKGFNIAKYGINPIENQKIETKNISQLEEKEIDNKTNIKEEVTTIKNKSTSSKKKKITIIDN